MERKTARPLTAILCVIFACSLFAQTQPVAPVRDVVDTYFGVQVSDPYRYLENKEDPEVVAWMKAQDAYTRDILSRIPGREALLERIVELDNAAAAQVSRVRRLKDETYFYMKMLPEENVRKLYMRKGLTGDEKLLVDPESFEKETGKPHAINYYEPSSDGRYVACGISEGGSEDAVLYVYETATLKLVDKPITRAQIGAVSWMPSNKAFLLNRLQEFDPETDPGARYLKSKVYLHEIGRDPETEPPIFGFGVQDRIELNPDDLPIGWAPASSKTLFAVIYHGVKNEISAYSVDLESAKKSSWNWKKLITEEDKVVNFDVHGGNLFLITFKDAPRYKVVQTSLSHPDLNKAKAAIPAGEAVVQGLTVQKDGLYILLLDGGINRLMRVQYDQLNQPKEVALPLKGSLSLYSQSPDLKGVLFSLESWTQDNLIYMYNPETNQVTDTGLKPKGPYDAPENLVSLEVKVASHDGVMIPLSIIYEKGLRLDGSHPALLYGYGAYGISEEPFYNPKLLAWYENGGIYAVAHVRGGGEYGEEWHVAGQKATKPNTWKDAIACAEYLIEKGYTSPAHLSIEGGSAGGIMAGRAITERPDLFKAAVPVVGVMDNIRAETTPAGIPNIHEFGTVKKEDEFKALLEMSSYHHVKDNVKYPAVLLIQGVNDPRVEVWHSSKMAARMQSATSSNNPILLRLDFESGHGYGDTKKQNQEELADTFSFLLWQLGAEKYQIKQD